jgi:hypothetical protein
VLGAAGLSAAWDTTKLFDNMTNVLAGWDTTKLFAGVLNDAPAVLDIAGARDVAWNDLSLRGPLTREQAVRILVRVHWCNSCVKRDCQVSI